MKEIISAIIENRDFIIPILAVIIGILGLKSIGYKITINILTSAIKWVKELEKRDDITGPEKMDIIIDYIKDFIPRIFKVLFSDKVIKSMADSVYDDMSKYSENRVQRKTGLTWGEMINFIQANQKAGSVEHGLYTFKDGTTMRYVGSFEKSLLAYMDQMNIVPDVSTISKEEEGS